MFENSQQRRLQEKIRGLQESKMTARKISIRLFILFGIYMFNLIFSFVQNNTGSMEKFMQSSSIAFIAGIAIGVVILTIPDYDGACRRAGICYIAGILLNILFFKPNSDTSAGILLLILVVESVLIIIYYMSFSFEMSDRISSRSSGSATFWKVIGVTFLIGYALLIILMVYLVGSSDEMTYSDAESFVNIFKLDAYALLAAQFALVIMTLVTAIMLKNYSEEPIMEGGVAYPPLPSQPVYQQPFYPQPGMQPPYAPNGMTPPPANPYAPNGMTPPPANPYAPTGMPPQEQPVPQGGMPPLPTYTPYTSQQVQPAPQPAPANFNPYASQLPPMAPLPPVYTAHNPRPDANAWLCTCGIYNPGYTGTCACGVKKNDLKNGTNRSKTSSAKSSTAPAAPKPSKASAEAERIRLLKEYKELLDSGVLSQEEFDKKKAELLNSEK